MKMFNKLPNSVRAAPGLERAILRKLPLALLLGTCLPLAASLANRVFPPDGPAAQLEKYIKMVDILSIATMVTVWSAGLTIAIGCFAVVAMKGPACVADAYELLDSDSPGPRSGSSCDERNRQAR